MRRHGLGLLALSGLVAPGWKPPNFLEQYGNWERSWHSGALNTNTIVYLSDIGETWPLDDTPWDWFKRVATTACSEKGCFWQDVDVNATIMPADDAVPVSASVSIVLEGFFNPYDDCCTRENFIHMMTVVLRSMYDVSSTELLRYDTRDPVSNQTIVGYRPIPTAPKAIGVGVGFRSYEVKRYWLSIKVNGRSLRRAPRNRCHQFLKHARARVKKKFENDLKERRRLGYVKCLWPGQLYESAFPPFYSSPVKNRFFNVTDKSKRWERK